MTSNSGRETYEKKLRPFLVLWSGQAVSLLGSQLVQFALIWWLTKETGSATVLAMASLVGMLPQVVLGPFVGVLVDRWDRRRTMFFADSSVALATVLLAYLFATGQVQLWHIYVLLFVRSLGGAFHRPAMMASTTLMVPEKHLTRIQGFNQMLQGGLNIVSAPLGALLLELLPLQAVLAIDVVTALFAIVPLLFIFVPQPEKKMSVEGADTAVTVVSSFWSGFWAEMREGLRYVRGWLGLMILMGLAMIINLMLTPSATLMPLLVTDYFGGTAWHLGGLESAFGIGILLGGLALGVWGGFERRIVTSLLGLVGLGLSVLLIGSTPASLFPLALVGMLGMGLMMAMTNGPILAMFQAIVAPEMQGRVLSLLSSLAMAMSPLGLIIAGPLADLIGVRSWYLIGGTVTLLLGVGGFFVPALMGIEDVQRPATSTLVPAVDGEIVGETAV